MPRRYRKQSAAAPPGYFTWEASGLRWLRDAGGAAVVEVLAIAPGHLDLEHLTVAVPSHKRAELLGRGLAITHGAGAPAFGSGPPGWRGNGWLGPLDEPLPLPLGEWPTWGEFLATARIAPLVRRGRDREVLTRADTAVLDRFTATVADGRYDTGEAPARLHGDLWSGNVLWTPDGAVLIDPAAHGGHREADLGMLALFGSSRPTTRRRRSRTDGVTGSTSTRSTPCSCTPCSSVGPTSGSASRRRPPSADPLDGGERPARRPDL